MGQSMIIMFLIYTVIVIIVSFMCIFITIFYSHLLFCLVIRSRLKEAMNII